MTASLDEYPNLNFDLSHRSKIEKIMEPFILTFLITVAFLGNVMICVTVCKSRRLRSVPNILVINLAVSDILMAIMCMPISLRVLISSKWPFVSVACDLQGCLLYTSDAADE